MTKHFSITQLPVVFGFLPAKDPRCGECTVCCTALGVSEFEKPPRTACIYEKDKSCSVYKDRPQSCRDYECLWLQGAMPAYARPDRFGVLFDAHPEGTAVVAREIEPGAFERSTVDDLMKRFASRFVLYIMTANNKRRIVGPPELVSAFMARYGAHLPKEP